MIAYSWRSLHLGEAFYFEKGSIWVLKVVVHI